MSPAGAALKRTEIDPPLLRTRTGPVTSWISMRPPLVCASTRPSTWLIVTSPPEVRALTSPSTSSTRTGPPEVRSSTRPSILLAEIRPPLVRASTRPSMPSTSTSPPPVRMSIENSSGTRIRTRTRDMESQPIRPRRSPRSSMSAPRPRSVKRIASPTPEVLASPRTSSSSWPSTSTEPVSRSTRSFPPGSAGTRCSNSRAAAEAESSISASAVAAVHRNQGSFISAASRGRCPVR